MFSLFARALSSAFRLPAPQPFASIAGLSAVLLATSALVCPGILAQTATPPSAATNLGSAAVGTSAPQAAVTFNVGTAGTLGTPLVLTQGTPNLDFTLGTGSTCIGAVTGGTCTVNVIFKPRTPGQRMGAVNLTNASGKVIATAFIYGTGTGPLIVLSPGTIRTVAGNAVQACQNATSLCGDGGPATAAQFGGHGDVTVDAAGNMYIGDRDLYRIRKVDAVTGNISTIAGTGVECNSTSCRDGGLAINALLGLTGRVAVDGAGNVYIPDQDANSIRKVDAVTGIITTYASGFNGPFDGPLFVTIDALGNLFATDRARVYKVAAGTGAVTRVAGTAGPYTGFNGDGQLATSAQMGPGGVAIDAAGNLYISDTDNNRIRKVDALTGLISTVAGSGSQGYDPTQNGGPATSAALYYPRAMALDAGGNLYFADTFNNVIRQVTTTGTIATIAGNGTQGFISDTGSATGIELYFPDGVAIDGTGNLLIHDGSNFRIRQVSGNAAPVAFASTAVGSTSADSPQTVTVTNTGNAALDFAVPASGTNPSITAGYFLGSSGTCPQINANGSASVLRAGASCTEVINFRPVVASPTNTGNLTLTDDNLNVAMSNQSVSLSGISTGNSVVVTPTLTLTVPTTSAAGATIGGTTLFASSSTSSPTGNITIYAMAAGSTTPIALQSLASASAVGGSGAAFSFTAPTTPGTYAIYASYAGDTHFNSASSSNSSLVIASVAKGTLNLNILYAVTAATGSTVAGYVTTDIGTATATPTGTVTITAQSTTGAIVTLTTFPAANAKTTLATLTSFTAPASGTYAITANYPGDANYNPSTSNVNTLTVYAAGPTTTTLAESAPAVATEGVPFTLTVRLTPGVLLQASISGNVVVTANPVSNSGTPVVIATIPAAQAVAAGGIQVQATLPAYTAPSYQLNAKYVGDTNYGPSAAVIGVSVFTTSKLSLTPPLATYAGTQAIISVQLLGNSPTGTIFLGTVLNGVAGPSTIIPTSSQLATITFPMAGTYTVNATYQGDTQNSSSTAAITVVVALPLAGPQFTMTLDDPKNAVPGSGVTINVGETQDIGVTLTALNGFSTPVQLTTKSSVLGAFGFTGSVLLLDSTGAPLTSVTPTAAGVHVKVRLTNAFTSGALRSAPLESGPTVFVCGLAGFLLLGVRRRVLKSRSLLMLGVLVAVVCGTVLPGCVAPTWQIVKLTLTGTPATTTQGAAVQTLDFYVDSAQ